jgi:CRP-like cAMP-binding protein
MNAHLRQLLEKHPIFLQFTSDQLDEAVNCAMSRHYDPGGFVTYYGDVWPYLLIVEAGRLDVIKESCDGKQLVALSLGPGTAFWGLAFFNDGMQTPGAVQAKQSSDIYLWSREAILPLMMASPHALWHMCQQMVTRMNQASQIVESLAFKPMAKRLASFLLEMFAETGETSVKRTLTLDDIAAHVGSTREEVCRALYQFADKNLIEITRTEFSLINRDGLSQMADER